MRAIKLFPVLAITAILFLMGSCTQDESFESELDKSADFSISLMNNNKSTTTNYQITNNTTVDYLDNKINMEFPVSADDFQHLKTYNISTENHPAILYLISRNNTESIVDLPSTHLIKAQVNLDAINMDMDLVENSKGISIFVMNNSKLLSEDDDMIKCLQEDMADNKIDNNCVAQNKSNDGPGMHKGDIIIR